MILSLFCLCYLQLVDFMALTCAEKDEVFCCLVEDTNHLRLKEWLMVTQKWLDKEFSGNFVLWLVSTLWFVYNVFEHMVERCSKESTLYPLFPLFYYSAALFLSQPAVTCQTKPKLPQKMSLNTSHAFTLCDREWHWVTKHWDARRIFSIKWSKGL